MHDAGFTCLAPQYMETPEGPTVIEHEAPVPAQHHLNFAQKLWRCILGQFLFVLARHHFCAGDCRHSFFCFLYRNKKKGAFAQRFANFLELVAETLLDKILVVLGSKKRKVSPFHRDSFVYIFCMNISGIIPLMKSRRQVSAYRCDGAF